MGGDVRIAMRWRLTPVWLDNSNSGAATMVCILSSTYSEPLHKIRFYTRAKQIPLRQHCTNCIGLILHRTVTIVSNLNGKTTSGKKYFHVICFLSGFAPHQSTVSHQHQKYIKNILLLSDWRLWYKFFYGKIMGLNNLILVPDFWTAFWIFNRQSRRGTEMRRVQTRSQVEDRRLKPPVHSARQVGHELG